MAPDQLGKQSDLGPHCSLQGRLKSVLVARLDHVNADANDLIRHTDTQCGPISDCSYESSLIWIHTVCNRGVSNLLAEKFLIYY